MDRLNRRRAKQSSAEVRIKFAMLSSQCKAAMEWEILVFVRALVTHPLFDIPYHDYRDDAKSLIYHGHSFR
jgi:hypothetical protein